MNDIKKTSKDPRPRDLYTSERGDPVRRAEKQAKKKWSNQKWRDWLDEEEEDDKDESLKEISETSGRESAESDIYHRDEEQPIKSTSA